MSFETIAKLHATYATSNCDVETVVWCPSRGIEDETERQITVVVDEDVEPFHDGDIKRNPVSPIGVHIAKADVGDVGIGCDQPSLIRRGDTTYRVVHVLSEDPGAWEVYCAR